MLIQRLRGIDHWCFLLLVFTTGARLLFTTGARLLYGLSLVSRLFATGARLMPGSFFKQLSASFADYRCMRNPRFLVPGKIHFITFRTEEGLPFVPLRFMNMLIRSALARAQNLYPVRIICFVVQANHVHLLVRVVNPEHVSGFIGYFKAESAHYLNRLLSRRQRTVWAERFDSPAVLDLEKALELFSYCSLNPLKDGLVSSMREYPGLSSYPSLMRGESLIPAKSIPRNKVQPLTDPNNPQLENKILSEYFSSDEFQDLSITLTPEDLRLAFPSTKDSTPEDFHQTLLHTLAKYEQIYLADQAGMPPLGAAKILSKSLLTPRNPPFKGKKMICLSCCRDLRQAFIATFKRIKAACRETFRKWSAGYMVPYPPGMFAPSLPRISNFVPQASLS
jgi:REP element-mobilizing transposase RayT